MKRITQDEQVQWLLYIDHHVKTKGWPPSIRDIQKHFDISSVSVVNFRMSKLIESGYLYREAGIARAIAITPDGRMFMESA
jgi:repressor LexA